MRASIASLILLLASVRLLAQDPQPPKPDAEDPKTVVRTYNVADLTRAMRDYPLGGGGFAAGLFGEAAKDGAKQVDLDPLSMLITETIDENSWRENGGSTGQVKSFGSLLVITQTEENHERIKSLLAEIRKNSSPSKIVSVQASWIMLNPADAPRPAAVVTDEWLKQQKLYCEGRTVCFSGQTVYVKSGRERTVVSDFTPIVATMAVAFDPEPDKVQSGVSLQIMPQLIPDAGMAIVDIQSYAQEWSQPGEPVRPAAFALGMGGNTGTMDRLNLLSQEMKTTLRIPLGKKIVVGGMTADPADEATNGRQLCLIVEVNAVE